MNFKIEGLLQNQSSMCVPILRMLPGYFGIEEAIQNYKRKIEHLPTSWQKWADRCLAACV